ncbi:hypothetical protein JTB14_025988 [Gonioctena quinquepunctata]|nr:hypothetical protein JTB14_025988 [Gonioctena quinquepunctata]
MSNMFQKILKLKIRTLIRCFSLHLEQNTSIKSLEEGLSYDLAIIGGGIIGTAIARAIKSRAPDTQTILVEKESTLGKHQSGHNSGVIHSGVYYKPGSLKAKFCLRGKKLLYNYCRANNIPYKTSGKLIIANDAKEIDILELLYSQGQKNGVNLKLFSTTREIKKIEPLCKGSQALWSPDTGNVDFKVLTACFGNDYIKNGGNILYNNEVNCIKASSDCDYPILLKCNENLYLKAKYLIICAGLQSGIMLDVIEEEPNECRVFITFRVNYQILKNQKISTNMYQTPLLSLPFLGIHLTPQISGDTLLGPTAIPAFKIEGYKADELNLTYLKNTLTSPNFKNMTKRYFSKCVDQLTKQLFPCVLVKELQKLADVSEDNIVPGPTAVQVQLVNADGTFEDDFVFEFFEGKGINKRMINFIFSPSPAATSSLAIAEYVTERFLKENCS